MAEGVYGKAFLVWCPRMPPMSIYNILLCVLCCQGHHDHQPLEEWQLWRELAGGPHLAGGGGGGAGHQEVPGHGVHVRDSRVRGCADRLHSIHSPQGPSDQPFVLTLRTLPVLNS